MRLTLRTLLAYLDDLLDEQDGHELQQKIEDSELASELVHRIRNTVGQIRLDAPMLDGAGMGADANSVSEYLDNTLPPERVPDFERVCLDSDVHLAEVAGCHQVLTLVLGEPVNVDPKMRKRIYDLAHSQSESHQAMPTTDQHVTSVELPTSADGAQRRLDTPSESHDPSEWKKMEKASYMKSKSSIPTLVITALIAFVLVSAGILGLGPLDEQHPLAGILGLQKKTQQIADNNTPSDEPDRSKDATHEIDAPDEPIEEESSDLHTNESITAQTNDLPDSYEVSPAELNLHADDENQPRGQVEFDTTDTDIFPNQDDAEDNSEIVESDSSTDNSIDQDILDFNQSTEPSFDLEAEKEIILDPVIPQSKVDLANPIDVPPEPRPDANFSAANEIENEVDSFPDLDLTSDSDPQATEPILIQDPAIGEVVDPPKDTVTEEEERVAIFDSDKELAVYQDENKNWQRVSAGPLQVGQPILSLPIFRPEIALANGMQIAMSGLSQLEIHPESTPASPIVNLHHGRFVITQQSETAGLLTIFLGDRQARIDFSDNQSSVALDVMRVHRPGNDPEANSPHLLIKVYPISGNVDWVEPETELVSVSAGQSLTILDQMKGKVESIDAVPKWISGQPEKPRDPFTKEKLEPKIKEGRLATLSLREQANNMRMLDVRSLSACSLACVGHFEAVVTAMNDKQLRAYWPQQVEICRKVIAIDAELAAQLRDKLIKRHGEDDGLKIYRMFWGYSESQLVTEAEILGEYLDHPDIGFRVVAHETLKHITGKTRLYSPGESARNRKSATWKRLIEQGIKYANPPEIETMIDKGK